MKKLVSLLEVSLFLFAVQVVGQESITVGPNVNVSSAHPNRVHSETFLAADPSNPDHLIGGSMIGLAGARTMPQPRTIVYVSFDRGRTWQATLEVGIRPYLADPAVAYGPDGNAFFICMGTSPGLGDRGLFVYRSGDGGRSWLGPVTLPYLDRPFISVDNTAGKYRGRVYLNGRTSIGSFDQSRSTSTFWVYRSIDGGATFEDPVVLTSADGNAVNPTGNGVVLSDGTYAFVFGELKAGARTVSGSETRYIQPSNWVKIIISEDGGRTFSKAVVIDDFYQGWQPPLPFTVNTLPYLAADSSTGPFKDRLYAVWPDSRSGRSEILLSYSSDKGKRWSRPITINDDVARPGAGKGPDDFMPAVAVNSSSVLGVMWYDRRESPDNLGWRTRFSASLDGGETFLPSIAVSEAAFDKDRITDPLLLDHETGGGDPARRGGTLTTYIGLIYFYFTGGDTAGLAADSAGDFHPFWIDNRTGLPQIWTAPVTVRGRAFRNGEADLENLNDISEKVVLQFAKVSYSRSTQTVTAEVSVANTSREALAGPIKVRVLSLTSHMGRPQILNASNHLTGTGAVWDFTSLLEGGSLKPGEKSKPKVLEFRLLDVQPIRAVQDSRYTLKFVSLETKVLGRL